MKTTILTVSMLLLTSIIIINPASANVTFYNEANLSNNVYKQNSQDSLDNFYKVLDNHLSKTVENRNMKIQSITDMLKNIKPRTAEIDSLIEETLNEINSLPQNPPYLASAWIKGAFATPLTYNAGGEVEIVAPVSEVYRLLETSLEEEFNKIDAKVETIKNKVATEQKRLEEEARKAAELAAQANTNSRYVPNGESNEQRVERLMKRLGVSIAYAIRECPIANALACYTPGTNRIVLEPRLFQRNDCSVARAITHEYRHHQQWIQGLMQIENGVLINRDWLEADASAHERC